MKPPQHQVLVSSHSVWCTLPVMFEKLIFNTNLNIYHQINPIMVESI